MRRVLTIPMLLALCCGLSIACETPETNSGKRFGDAVRHNTAEMIASNQTDDGTPYGVVATPGPTERLQGGTLGGRFSLLANAALPAPPSALPTTAPPATAMLLLRNSRRAGALKPAPCSPTARSRSRAGSVLGRDRCCDMTLSYGFTACSTGYTRQACRDRTNPRGRPGDATGDFLYYILHYLI